MKRINTIVVSHLALFIALQIVLSRFLSISTPVLRISLGFVPVAIAASLYGVLPGALVGAVADFLGAVLFPTGAYFPGFTLTAFLTGSTYGLLLYKKDKSWARVIISVLVVSVFLNLGLNTLWLMILTNKGYLALIPARLLQNIIMIPLQVIIVKTVTTKSVLSLFKKSSLS